MHRTQYLRRHDLDRGVEVKEAHDDQEPGRRAVEPALKPADRTLLFLDEFLGLLQSLIGDERLFRRLRAPVGVGHSNPPLDGGAGIASRVGSPPDAGSVRQTADNYSTFTPCSARYFFAPGWNGSGEPTA